MVIEVLEKIETNWILVMYDVSRDDNYKRDKMRQKLIDHFGGRQMTQSCYMMPKSVALIDEIKRWGQDNHVELKVIGMTVDLVAAKTLTQEYTAELKMRLMDVDEEAENIWKELLEKEDNIDNPKKSSLTGFTQKIKSIKQMFDDLQKIINKYGNESDSFQLQKVVVFMKNIEDRYNRFVAMKKQYNDEREMSG